jgi:hypothetical protein
MPVATVKTGHVAIVPLCSGETSLACHHDTLNMHQTLMLVS